MRYLKGATWYLAVGTVNELLISLTCPNYPHSNFSYVLMFTFCRLPLTFVRPCPLPQPQLCFLTCSTCATCYLSSYIVPGPSLPQGLCMGCSFNLENCFLHSYPTADNVLVNSYSKFRGSLNLPSLTPQKPRLPSPIPHTLPAPSAPPKCHPAHNNHRIISVTGCNTSPG